MGNKVLFAGSFNPFTIGHLSVYNNAHVFSPSRVIVGITQNPNKKDYNPHIIKWVTNAAFPWFDSLSVRIVDEPLLVDYAKKNNIHTLIRSLRNSIDLVHEVDLATWNKTIGGIDTVFIPSDASLNHVSSSAIREIDSLGKDMADYFVNKIQYNRWKVGKPKRIIVVGKMGSGKSSFINDFGESMLGQHYSVTSFTSIKYPMIDMDAVVKNNMSKESTKLMQRFFEDTPVEDIMSDWNESWMDIPKQEVEDIVHNKLDFGNAKGIYEISAFTAYNLEQYYNDSVIVYVDNYTNGTNREIDHEMYMKSMQLQKIPNVIDFVIDRRKDNVKEVVYNIKCLMEG